MLPILFDRFLMAFSLAVHIPFAVIGVALPFFILVCEIMYYRRKDPAYKTLAKRLSIVLLILFAVGTASGTIVALELLFLWPKFFTLVGQVAILPLFCEVFAFFAEAIFLAIYIYFGDRIRDQRQKIFIIGMIALGGALSAAFITMINAFMNTPTGFNIPAYIANGTVTDVAPLAVFNSPSSTLEVIHVLATSYFAGTFIFVAYFAYRLWKSRKENEKAYYKKAIKIGVYIVLVATLITIYTGSASLVQLEHQQPEKYAAIEANLVPQTDAPEYIGGFLSANNTTLVDYIAIPGLQSLLADGNESGSVPGLSQFPQDTWPPLFIHIIFDLLVFCGFGMGFLIFLIVVSFLLKRNPLRHKIVLLFLILGGMAAVFLLEGGWIMSEVGRQPWIIYNVMLVSDAGNQSSGIIPIAIAFICFYAVIIPLTAFVLKGLFDRRPLEKELVKNGAALH